MKYWVFILISSFLFSQRIPTYEVLSNKLDFEGTIHRIMKFPSKYVQVRTVDVWLPEGYSNTKKYEVLYMHDGQMLFDGKTTWNKQEWGVDETISELTLNQQINEVIVVAIWNIPEVRHLDYFPQKAMVYLTREEKKIVFDKANSLLLNFNNLSADNYLKFIVNEVKPYVDSTYSVETTASKTAIMGSSMGGLISMYALCEYPNIFGKAACLSTHWIGLNNLEHNPIPEAIFSYLNRYLPQSKTHKIYFDYGTETLDASYLPYQSKVSEILRAKGYNSFSSENKRFEAADHSENAWKNRLSVPLLFLFKK
ncbi:alpha/beta hydrolase [Flavobacterium sp.]|jgi:enterochelin esterase-like enzyme|uniref:alpha/beta hydrolase n=1 Tax=Flavobacterium sp. TaxID=239 RepID=UPI0037C0AE6D